MASNENDLDRLNTELKKELSSLIISCPKGLTIKRLRFDYREFFGSDVPFKRLGYNSFEQYLLAIPNTCRLNGSGDHALVVPVVSEKSKHINDMILKQKAPKSNSRYRPPRRCRGIYNTRREPAPPPKPVVPFKLPILNPDSHQKLLPPPHDYILDMRRQQNVSTKFNKKPQENHVSNSCNNYPLNEMYETDGSGTSGLQRNVKKVNIYPRDEMYRIEDPCTSGLQRISYKTYENKMTELVSDEDSDAEFYQELEYSEDEDFCYKSEDDEDLTTCINNMVVRDDLPGPLLDMPIVEIPHVSRVNNRVKEKLQQLIADYPDGIWCSKLLRYYEQKFHQQLDPEHFGFSSVIQMCDDLPDVFYCIRPNRMDWKLYDKTKPVPDIHSMRDFSKYLQTLPISQDNRSNTEPALPTDILYTPTYKYPDDVLHPGEVIERQWLVNYEKPGEYIELVISEVYDPSKFWIQFKGPTTSDALGKVMDEMQVYYMHNAGTLQLNEFSVRIGLMCSALFMNEFHRAIVIKVFDDQTIKVFYVDYGTVGQVQLKRTCFLHRNFSELPMQAVRARLANIIPIEPNTMWPRAASNYMLQLIMEKDLIAYITAIDQDEEILELIVTDTTMPDVDIHINDMLVEKGYAVLGNEALMCESSSALVPNVHLYPTFEELENFIYPSVSDVITMLKLGHTYETIFDGYFITSANSSNPHNYSDLHHSRSSTSMEQQSFCLEHEPVTEQVTYYDPEETNADFIQQTTSEENCAHVHENVLAEEEQNEECESESDNVSVPENVHTNSNEEQISSVNTKSFIDEDVISNYTEEYLKTEESLQSEKSNIFSGPPPPGFRNCPPGFENVQPYNGNQLINMFRREPTEPLMPEPVYNYNSLTGYPLVQNPLISLQNFSLMNPALNLFLSNPLLYNQLNQLMINQQREALQREVLLQTVQQVKFVEEIQRLKTMNQQHQFARMNQAEDLPPQNYNVPKAFQNVYSYEQNLSTAQNSKSGKIYEGNDTPVEETTSASNDLHCRINPGQTNIRKDGSNNYYDQAINLEFTNNDIHITTNLNENNKESISNISEHICDRYVVKLKLKDCIIHVLKIDSEFYVASQEIISNLLNYDLPLKTWMKSVNLNISSFPNKLVNIMNYKNVYTQIKSYSIPGINPPNNLGCNVRLTPLNNVADIVQQFGNINILPDLKAGITRVMEKPDMWKVLDSSD